jgi:hypothetical protein
MMATQRENVQEFGQSRKDKEREKGKKKEKNREKI